jgi:putative transposase
MALSTAS